MRPDGPSTTWLALDLRPLLLPFPSSLVFDLPMGANANSNTSSRHSPQLKKHTHKNPNTNDKERTEVTEVSRLGFGCAIGDRSYFRAQIPDPGSAFLVFLEL